MRKTSLSLCDPSRRRISRAISVPACHSGAAVARSNGALNNPLHIHQQEAGYLSRPFGRSTPGSRPVPVVHFSFSHWLHAGLCGACSGVRVDQYGTDVQVSGRQPLAQSLLVWISTGLTCTFPSATGCMLVCAVPAVVSGWISAGQTCRFQVVRNWLGHCSVSVD